MMYRPQTLGETLHLLRQQGVHTTVVTGPEALQGATSLGIDMSQLGERNGVHQFAGRLLLGLNMTLAELARSSLLRSQATCLVEACAHLPLAASQPLALALEGLLSDRDLVVSDFWPPLVALVALDASIELAWLDAQDRIEQNSFPLSELSDKMLSQPAQPALPLSVSLAVAGAMSGSAFVPVPATPGIAPTPLAVAVSLAFAADGQTVARAGIALVSPLGIPVRAPAAEESLRGHLFDRESIGSAAERAQHFALAQWPAASTARSYPIQLAGHLVRTALDRAAARAGHSFCRDAFLGRCHDQCHSCDRAPWRAAA